MASLTIRKLDEDLKKRLRAQARRNGRSMEEEGRVLLEAGLEQGRGRAPGNAGDAIAAIFDPLGGVELDLPSRQPSRDPPRFDSWPE